MKYISGNMFYFFEGVCYGEYIFINFFRVWIDHLFLHRSAIYVLLLEKKKKRGESCTV